MEYIYASLILHKAGKEINEANLKKILEAAGVQVDENKLKAVVAALAGVDIEKAIKESASVAPIAVSEKKEEKAPEKPIEEPSGCPKCKGTDISLLSPGKWQCDNATCRFKIDPALQAKIAADVAAEERGEEIGPSEPDPNARAKPASMGIGPPAKMTPDRIIECFSPIREV